MGNAVDARAAEALAYVLNLRGNEKQDDALLYELGDDAYSLLTYAMSDASVKDKDFFANEVCWAMNILMEIGGMNLPLDERHYLAEPLLMWSMFAYQERGRQDEARKVRP